MRNMGSRAPVPRRPSWRNIIRRPLRTAHLYVLGHAFSGSNAYWEQRYRAGGSSGAGSYGPLAQFKAEILNDFVASNGVVSVIELGCGDGAQLSLAEYPSYVGIDISEAAIDLCRQKFVDDTAKAFFVLGHDELPRAELGLSLDVIYHLVEDSVFEDHIARLFTSASRFVILYTSDTTSHVYDYPVPPHIRHRPVLDYVRDTQPRWRLIDLIPNRFPFRPGNPDTSFADFLIFQHLSSAD